jgi:hypothetical protein
VKSNDILKLLSEKHSEDVFVPECKNGSTWLSTHLRLDAWVMNRSWTKLKFTGYEIKVSRQDFLRDDTHDIKWHNYSRDIIHSRMGYSFNYSTHADEEVLK